jgi:hypothetical protein
MSRILKVKNGDYRIVVTSPTPITGNPESQSGTSPQIILDTGVEQGRVVVTGDLQVRGNTTTIQSETLAIRDNTIYLNTGESESHAGVSLNTSGLQINRGSLNDAQLLFDEQIDFYSPTTANRIYGTFVFKDESNLLRGIKTNSIETGGGDLSLIGHGTGVVTVTGTTNYEDQLGYTAIDGNLDALPNKQWVLNYVLAEGGVAIVDRLYSSDTGIRAYDDTVAGPPSNIKFKFDNVVRAVLTGSTWSLNVDVDVNGKILIHNNEISTQQAGDNLKLIPSVNQSVEVAGPLQLDDTTGPTAVSGSTKIYTLDSSTPGTGKTGIYFTSYGNSDELIAKNRALLWSMLF